MKPSARVARRILRLQGRRAQLPPPAPAGGFDYPAVLRGTTAHFQVYYDPDLGAAGSTIADGVLATCESDYATLSGWICSQSNGEGLSRVLAF